MRSVLSTLILHSYSVAAELIAQRYKSNPKSQMESSPKKVCSFAVKHWNIQRFLEFHIPRKLFLQIKILNFDKLMDDDSGAKETQR